MGKTRSRIIRMADFETTTLEDDCRVWAWGTADIQTPEDVDFGNSIDTFMEFVENSPGIYYFHNLKFDGNFLIYWLLKHGYKYNHDSRNLDFKQFSAMISDQGIWYTITVMFAKPKNGIPVSVTFRDSSRVIPLPVDSIPKAFGLEEEKLDLDYVEFREIGHELTLHEKEYLANDVIIVAKALKFMFEQNQTKLTAASNALNDYKQRIGTKTFSRLFPALEFEVDAKIRKSYKGGWTYLNQFYKNKDIQEGAVYDVNSMYPWAMKYCLLPYGKPWYYEGEYQKNKNYPLYIQHIQAAFRIKPGRYPSIQIKNSFFADNVYLETSYDEKTNPGGILDLWLTSVDLELFFYIYDVDFYKPIEGFMFMGKVGMFTEYVDYWYDMKTKSKKTKNKGMETIAKRMLNSLYGKFGSRMVGKSKIPYYDPEADQAKYLTPKTREQCVEYNIPLPKEKYDKGEYTNIDDIKYGEEKRKGGYLPVATFITSYCRDKIIRSACICGSRFIYGDTDSLHIVGQTDPPGLDVDEYRLGAFKCEEVFVRGRFIRQKTYLEVYLDKDGKEKLNIKACGMPDKMKSTVTEEKFVEGKVFDASEDKTLHPKLMPKIVPGGVILKETTFRIKKQETSDTFCVQYDGRFHYADCPYASRYV